MKSGGTKAAFMVLWALLLVPALATLLAWNPGRVLHGQSGWTEYPKISEWTWNNIRSMKVQTRFERALGDNAGFRNLLVRTYNELEYRLFGSINARGVLIGNDGSLLEEDYLNEVTGLNSIGDSLIREGVGRLARIGDSLEQRYATKILVVLPPSKARCQKGVLPVPRDFYAPANYHHLLAAFKESGIEYLDLNPVFSRWADTAGYPLFPRLGGHWSEYGCVLASDTILDWLAGQTGLEPPDFSIKGYVLAEPSIVDKDLGTILNIWSKPQGGEMLYPWYEITYPQGWDARQWLVIGDSHFEQMLNKSIFSNMQNGEPEFWMYNRIRVINRQYPGDASPETKRQKLPATKYLLIVFSERFYHTLFWGAPIDLAEILQIGPERTPQQRVIADILNDPSWFAKVREHARLEKIPIELALKQEADSFLGIP